MDVTIKDALTIMKKGGVGQSILSANEKDSVSSASSTMAKSGKTSLAVIEKDTQKFLGFVDTLDIAFHIVNNMMENSNAHPDEVDWSKSELVFKKKAFGHEEVGKILGMSRPAASPPRTFTLADSLRAVMEEMGNGQPRVAVLDGSKIVEVLSQSDVLSYIFWNMNGLSHKIQRADVDTIFECVKAKRISFTVPTSATAAQAVYVMKYHRVHCVGIVNKRGELVANFSASDVRGLTEHNLKHLAKPVMEYLLLRSQAFSEDEAAVKSVRPVVSCSSETSFESLVEKFFYYRLHRIWIVDGKHKPITPISLTDVIRFMHFVTGMGKSFF